MAIPTLGERFLALHLAGTPLIAPNPWDVGAAVMFEKLGFQALATTSSGFALTLGRHDGQISREEALTHSSALVQATSLPVSADLERGFGDTLDAVAETYTRAARIGLAGASIEDSTGNQLDPIQPIGPAAARVQAAAEAAHGQGTGFVLTGRADNHFHGITDLDDTIRRLQAYQEAGADVLYAPGLTSAADIRSVVESVDRPVNVLFRANGPSVPELAELGVARVSIGGSFTFAAYGAAARAAKALMETGTYQASELIGEGRQATSGFGEN